MSNRDWNSVTTTRICPNCNYVFSSTSQPGESIRKELNIPKRNTSDMVKKLAEHTASYAEHNQALEEAQRDSNRHKVTR